APGYVQHWIGELAALLAVQIADSKEDARENLLIELGLARRRQCGVLPLQPPGRVHERAVLLGKARSGKPVDRGRDLLHLFRGDARRLPELARLIRVDLADDQPVRFLERIDILLGIRTDGDAVHAEREEAFYLAGEHVVPDLRPGVLAVGLRK